MSIFCPIYNFQKNSRIPLRLFNLGISSVILTIFLFTALIYGETNIYPAHLRPRLEGCTKTFSSRFSSIGMHLLRTPHGLNSHFGILADVDLEKVVEGLNDKDREHIWVMFGDMSMIRLLNSVYPPEIIDILIPMTIRLIAAEIERYGGRAGRVGVRGDEIWILLPSKYNKEEVDKIRRDIQEKIAESITGTYWGCEVRLKKGEGYLNTSLFDPEANALYNEVQDMSYGVLGYEDPVPGLYRTKSGVYMFFKGPPVELLQRPEEFKEELNTIITRNIERLNNIFVVEKGINVEIDSERGPVGLLSPVVFFGATQIGDNIKKAFERAERILNVEKGFGEEGGVDGLIGPEHQRHVDLERRPLEPLSYEEIENAIGLMWPEEISGVRILPHMFDPSYPSLGEFWLRVIAEQWLGPITAEAMVRPTTSQPTLVGLLDVRYVLEDSFRDILDREFPTADDKIERFRGERDDVFGLTVGFKYFNDALTGNIAQELGLQKEGHTLGNLVLKEEAKAILISMGRLERKKVLLFRGPPDNWWFLFLGQTAQDLVENPSGMAKFVDTMADAINDGLRGLGLKVKVRLRMNIVSSNAYGRGVASIIEIVKNLRACREPGSCDILTTPHGNLVKEYNPHKHAGLIREMASINNGQRIRGIRYLQAGRMAIIERRRNKGQLTKNDIATIRIMVINGWLGSEVLAQYRLASNEGIVSEKRLPIDFSAHHNVCCISL